MRELDVSEITSAVNELFLEANYRIGPDVIDRLEKAKERETSALGHSALEQILQNDRMGAEESLCVCQDTGISVVFLTIGQEVHLKGGSLEDAVNSGVRKAYTEGYLRKSVVAEPLFDRQNTSVRRRKT